MVGSSFDRALQAARETWQRFPLVNDPTRFSAAADAFFNALEGEDPELARLRAVEQAARVIDSAWSRTTKWSEMEGFIGNLRSALSEPAAEGSGE